MRHLLYEGDVAWTREGHLFAWRMKLIDRWSPGFFTMAYLPEKHLLLVPPMHKLLTKRQYDKASTRPRMAQRIAPQLAAMLRKAYKVDDVRVHMYYPVGYNNREPSLLIDPRADLVTATIKGHPAPWIIKTNNKPLRRIEEFSAKYTFPDLKTKAKMMGLPIAAGCEVMPNKWVRCYATRPRHLSKVADR